MLEGAGQRALQVAELPKSLSSWDPPWLEFASGLDLAPSWG